MASSRPEWMSERAWKMNRVQSFTLCEATGEHVGPKGMCPIHNSDACLFQYAKVRDLEREELLEPADG